TGALIIEGQYDDQLNSYYKGKLKQQVLMIQQLRTAPFPLTNPAVNQGAPGAPRPALSVNGRLDPVVTMAPGEVQLWRVINGAFRDAVQLRSFFPQSLTPCVPPAQHPPEVRWRQIAQDGVQFKVENYTNVGRIKAP